MKTIEEQINSNRPELTFDIRQMSEDAIRAYVRGILTVDDKRLRFNMSGYENKTGECTVHNNKILDMFAHLGIYDYSDFLAINFHKGTGVILFAGWRGDSNTYEMGGEGTVDIIYKILELTILSGNGTRRRW